VTAFSLEDDLALALALAGEADLISMDRYRSVDLEVTAKPDRTPVTDADRRIESRIRERLEGSRPDDALLGEEFGAVGDARRQWIVDPIDGTANFLRGVPVWATLIALAVDGVPVLGVVSAPALGRRWWGANGHGAWLQEHDVEPRRLAVSGVTDLADASLSYNSLKGWDEAGRLEDLLALSRSVWRTRAYGEAWPYLMVAEGTVDITGEFDLKPWDIAAIAPIVTEAGGRFSSVDGEPGIEHGSALATNHHLHDAVLGVFRATPEA
jgi:histidinol-phosphatase